MRPGDCHHGEYAPVLVWEHCVMETLVEPYDRDLGLRKPGPLGPG